MYPNQVVLQLAMKIAYVLLSFEMSQYLIEEKKLDLATWDKTSETCQIMELAKHASKSGFATVIRTGDDE